MKNELEVIYIPKRFCQVMPAQIYCFVIVYTQRQNSRLRTRAISDSCKTHLHTMCLKTHGEHSDDAAHRVLLIVILGEITPGLLMGPPGIGVAFLRNCLIVNDKKPRLFIRVQRQRVYWA